MPKTANSSKFKALDAAVKAFNRLASENTYKPLKYKVLTTLAQAEGWKHEGAQPAYKVMYEALTDAIANGDERLTAHGRGYFSLTEHNIMPNELPEYAAVKRMGTKARQERIEEQFDVELYKESTCGKCQFITFNGIKEVTLEGGICMNEESSRCGVRSDTPACILWVQRSEKQQRNDIERAYTLRITLNQIAQNNNKKGKSKRAGKVG